ncbi:hypothetical protein GCM10007049_37670 [Echinicola pacifica]|uniref:Uncharacterized protein n=1 Tax=Echinicola pacifica TaxID=346377 RepID=A0A918QBH3_9BACT|nr:hypothetical protein GCM10007049_37670 [Echinicola pacifica]
MKLDQGYKLYNASSLKVRLKLKKAAYIRIKQLQYVFLRGDREYDRINYSIPARRQCFQKLG